MPPWGPSAVQLSQCSVDAHLPARGEDRHYSDNMSDEDVEEDPGQESGGEDEDFGTLDALDTADAYRNPQADDYYMYYI